MAHQIKPLPAEADDARFPDESASRNTSGLPGQGLSEMPFDHNLNGRMEKRLPIIVVVRLAQAESAGTDGEERTYTDNISARGARVYSVRLWQLGDAVHVTAQNEAPTCGNVVYCQRLADDRYAVGVKFLDPTLAWSAVRRFDGFTYQPRARSNPS